MAFRTVAICGVGLIGGSFGLALRKAGFSGEILGVSSPGTIAEAVRMQAIDRGTTLEEALKLADLIYLSQPIPAILDCLPLLDAAKPTALITDAGSTKAVIVDRARRPARKAQFLGGHPMAGKEVRGVAAAEAGLFAGRSYFLTPEQAPEIETESASELRYWLDAFQCNVHCAAPDQHDRIVAYTSHLAQLASTALAGAIANKLGVETAIPGAGPGLIDMSRLAMSSYDLWSEILVTNSKQIDIALGDFIEVLTQIRASMPNNLENQFKTASSFAKSLRNG
jgi:prephenate dehydrogenase